VPLSRVFSISFSHFIFPFDQLVLQEEWVREDLRPKKNGFDFARAQVKG
jgi:hypothetical protein